jgi:hypothetical protein
MGVVNMADVIPVLDHIDVRLRVRLESIITLGLYAGPISGRAVAENLIDWINVAGPDSLADVLKFSIDGVLVNDREMIALPFYEDEPAAPVQVPAATKEAVVPMDPDSVLMRIREEVRAYEAKHLDGTAPAYSDSRSPDGDDYNNLHSIIMHDWKPDPVRDAAADLLAAAKAFEKIDNNYLGYQSWIDASNKAIELISAAIAKAEGKTNG